MKKTLIIALATVLTASMMLFAACGNNSEDQTTEETTTTTTEAAGTASLQDFVETQNGIFSSMNSEELAIVVSSEGTTLVYTYQFFADGLYEDLGVNAWDNAAGEGQLLFDTAKAAVPEITAVKIVFEDAGGTVLQSQEFTAQD
ncbi:MAG: hypothetical protein FWE46_02040 [Coriobacteriia bacterium]|nr:hypothetical protein [Coriobacteriia bacterium]MCL2537660.1 hypothetical protein [Coriobacteriia bacterium]